MSHSTEIREDVVIHHRDNAPPLIHPHPSDFIWTRCCGLIVRDSEILDPPEAMEAPRG